MSLRLVDQPEPSDDFPDLVPVLMSRREQEALVRIGAGLAAGGNTTDGALLFAIAQRWDLANAMKNVLGRRGL